MPVGALLAPLVVEGIGAVAPELIGAGTLLGTTAAPGLAAEAIGGVVGGAGLGAGEAAITGGNPALGATGGAAGGAVSSVAGPALESLGINPTLSNTIAGGAGGLTNAAVTGGNPLAGGAIGAAGGALSGSLSPSTSSAASPLGTGAGSGGASATPGPAGGGVGAGGGGGSAPGSPASASPVTSVGGSPPSSTDATAAIANTTGPSTGRVMDLSNLFAPTDFTAGTPFNTSLGFNPSGSSVPIPANINTSTAPAGTGSTGGGISKMLTDWISKNPGALLGGALLGGEALFGNNTIPGLSAVQQTAGQEKALAGDLLSGIQTGAVPPGAQALLDQLTSSMKAKVQGQYASLGLSGSTMEAQDLAKVDQTVAGQKWNIINSLLTTGVNELGQAGTLDQQIMTAQIQNDQELQRAIAAFAGAVAGGGLKAAA